MELKPLFPDAKINAEIKRSGVEIVWLNGQGAIIITMKGEVGTIYFEDYGLSRDFATEHVGAISEPGSMQKAVKAASDLLSKA